MAMDDKGGMSGYSKATNKPNGKKKIAERKTARQAFVSEKVASKGITPAQARQRFFVQTRMSEMKAKGKTVTPEMRKKLQQKFQSGDVARKGFAAPKKKTGTGTVTAKVTPAQYTPPRTAKPQDRGRGSRGASGK